MARIIYGVSGEGSGHSSRAREMAGHLVRQGHEVKIVSYDRGYRNLKDSFDVFEAEGLHITSIDNKVSILRTLTGNMMRLPKGREKLSIIRRELFQRFQPDCVITDFEPITAYLATHNGLPLITIDNQHRMRYMEYPGPPGLGKDQFLTETVIRAIVPRPDVSLVTTFYHGRPKNDRTFLFPPILRREVLETAARDEDFILVYLTSGFDSFLELLCGLPHERFIVYGSARDSGPGHLRHKPHSREGFLSDLAGCRAVMATAGFTLMSEAFYLQKPFFALPMKGQFEQELNAFLLEKLGYGVNGRVLDRDAISAFLERLPEFKENLRGYGSGAASDVSRITLESPKHDPCLDAEGGSLSGLTSAATVHGYPASDNREIKAKLDELIADSCALAREYHRRRAE